MFVLYKSERTTVTQMHFIELYLQKQAVQNDFLYIFTLLIVTSIFVIILLSYICIFAVMIFIKMCF